MFNILPSSREELMLAYDSKGGKLENMYELKMLEPSYCAKARDLECFSMSPFPSILNDESKVKIHMENKFIYWIHPKGFDGILKLLELDLYSLKAPCMKRIEFIELNIHKLIALFPREIKFICEFTSTICWIEPYNTEYIGSAGYYEVPHCTFFSDAAMFSLPPEIIVPEEFSEYAIFENFYHEALHHQMHAFSAINSNKYLIYPSNIDINIPWRQRKFTLLEGFHALHVYASVTPLRMRFYYEECKEDNNLKYEWLLKAIFDSVRMWEDLSMVFLKNISKFKEPWPFYIRLWSKECEIFIKDHRFLKEHVNEYC